MNTQIEYLKWLLRSLTQLSCLAMVLVIPVLGCTSKPLEPGHYTGESYYGGQRGTMSILTANGSVQMPYQTILIKNKTYAIAEGDILLGEVLSVPESQAFADMMERPDLLNEAGTLDTLGGPPIFQQWPHGIIPYAFDPLFMLRPEALEVTYLMKYIEDNTAVNFVLRDPNNANQNDYLYFTSYDFSLSLIDMGISLDLGYKCAAPWGHNRGPNLVVLSPNYCDRQSILHEMLHAVGLLHEHTRHDRDNYITINDAAMQQEPGDDPTTAEVETTHAVPQIKDHFVKHPLIEGEAIGSYDFYSVMQWEPDNKYSVNGPTITAKPGYEADYAAAMAVRADLRRYLKDADKTNPSYYLYDYPEMSATDIQSINEMYAEIQYADFYLYYAQSSTQKDYWITDLIFENWLVWNSQHQKVFSAQKVKDDNASAVEVHAMFRSDSSSGSNCLDWALVRPDGKAFLEAGGWVSQGVAFYADLQPTIQNPVPTYAYWNPAVCDFSYSTVMNDPRYINNGYTMALINPQGTTDAGRYTYFYVHQGPN